MGMQGTYIEFKDSEAPDAWLDSLPKGDLTSSHRQFYLASR